MNIRRALKDLGFDTVGNKFYSLIDLWNAWYKGNVEDFHSYTVWNGIEELECHRYSVGMGKKVCEDWANLLMNERVNITLEGKQEQEFIDTVFADNNWEVKANESQERKAAVGTVAYVPVMEGMGINPDTAEIIDFTAFASTTSAPGTSTRLRGITALSASVRSHPLGRSMTQNILTSRCTGCATASMTLRTICMMRRKSR